MSEPESIVSAQLQNLLDAVHQHRDRRCHALRETAHQQAGAIINKAYQTARRRVHQVIQDNREQAARQVASAQAQYATRQRQQRQRSDQAFLEAAWQQLREALKVRWQSPQTRRDWMDGIVQQAQQVLRGSTWQITHPPSLATDELARITRQVKQLSGRDPQLQADETVSAGLRISTHNACVDGTLEGLLSDRPRIAADLLALNAEHGHSQ